METPPHSTPSLQEGQRYQITFCCRDQLVGQIVTFLGHNEAGEEVIRLADGRTVAGHYNFVAI